MPQELVSNRYMSKLGMAPMQITWNESLTFDEVAKFFAVPIAEAANILGVCSSVLKKICRDNGIPRWPYRKFLAGKTVEDIKREAVKDKEMPEDPSKASNENDKSVSSSGSPSLGISPAQVPSSRISNLGPQMQSKSGNTVPGVSTSGHILHPSGFRISQNVRQHLYHLGHHRFFVPTYLDDFKQGFPKNGLSSVSNRWWGSSGSVSIQNALEPSRSSEVFQEGIKSDEPPGSEVKLRIEEDSKLILQMGINLKEEKLASKGEGISNLSGNMDLHDEDFMHITILSRTRKKHAENGRKALKLAVARGYGPYKLGAKEKSCLGRIFGFPLPQQWNACLTSTDPVL